MSEDGEADSGTDDETATAVDDDPTAAFTRLETELDSVRATLEAAETEADLDEIDDAIASLRSDLEEITLPEPTESDEDDSDDDGDGDGDDEDPIEDLESAIDDLESAVEDERGPYADDVITALSSVEGTIDSTRWTTEGVDELHNAVEAFVDTLTEIDRLGSDISTLDVDVDVDVDSDTTAPTATEDRDVVDTDAAVIDQLTSVLDRTAEIVDSADLGPDADAETISQLLDVTATLESAVDDATAWTDLEVREQLRRKGYYDVLDHVKDFPPEWHALKIHEKRGNVDMVLLALDSLDSDFMEEHALDALDRMGHEAAIDPMLQKVQRRDTKAMSVLGSIGIAEDRVVEALVEYVDSDTNPGLQLASISALGQIGAEDAVESIAEQLSAANADVRSVAARSLGLIGDTRAIPALQSVLDAGSDEEGRVRASAAWALVQIGTADALEIASEYAEDRSYLVQAEAKKASV